jgi:hypothetical protein
VFKSKRVSLLTIFALLLPSSAGLATLGASAANAADNSLSTFTVNGVAVENGSSVDLDPYTTSVAVVATPTDSTSTVAITGDTELHTGDNPLVVTVSNVDETPSVTYNVNLNVPLSDQTGSIITVNGEELINGESTEVDWGTSAVTVVVTPTDSHATFTVTGDTGLDTGDNLIDVVVTAADGISKEETQITLTVLPNTDTAVSAITVDGFAVADGDVVAVDSGVTDVVIEVVTVDADATFDIQGGSELVSGENPVSIWVTAADGITAYEYTLTLKVAYSTDTTLSTFTVGGFDVEDNDILDLDPLTTEVDVAVETADSDASFVVTGGTDLVPGENDLYVTVYAADGETVREYYVVLNVLPNTDTSLASFTINGNDVSDGDIVDLDPFTEDVEVAVETVDPDATYVIDGDANLVVGENILTLTVTAADEMTTMDYQVTLNVALSNDASLDTAYVAFTGADGEAVSQQVIDGDEVFLPSNTQSVDVAVTTKDGEATFEISGDSGLQVGENELVITVTAADGEAQEVTTVSLVVAVGDVTTNSFTVNGLEVEDGMVVDLEPGTEEVEVLVETTDPLATTSLEGESGLEFGTPSHLVLTVTSVDGTATATYDVVLNVLPYTDATAKTISVNGTEWVDGNPVEVDAGDLTVEVEGNSPGTTFEVTGNTTNVSGLVTLTVTVSAQDGETTESYDVEVLASTELEIVAGSVPTDGTIRVGTYAKLTKDQFAGSKVTYQWLNDGAAIDGATAYRYLITPDDFGHNIRVVVIKTTAGVAQTLVSKPVEFEAGIIKKAPTPGIKGKAVVGGTLTAVARTWTTDVELAYQWYADGSAIDGATEDTFEITPSLVDAAISVGVTGSLSGYATIEKLSAELTVKPGTIRFTTKPSISGTLEVGETLEVDPGSLSIDGAEVTYVWSRNGEEIDNTEATYTLTPDDFKKRITVEVIANAEGYNQASTKVKTKSIKAGTLADVPTPAISGEPIVGEVLTVDTGEYPDGTTFKFVWSRNNRVIAGANEEYTVNKRDIGQSIKVRVIATIPGYNTVSILAEGVTGAAE